MQINSPDTYIVSCSPALMTVAELRRAIADAWNGYSSTIDAEAAKVYLRRYQTLRDEQKRRR